ncbi:hypothetical protein [Pelosinus sp. UFO1]|uniref:hypothetical protein n=1 Tax=Pelosinus sp. UFO1 TaxID=484770 RepID=UPI0004D0E8FA|nr:hypothetical protein [Pelosinus sp. UFO1]AIF51222.1 hypothetical protein UFO1_1671 [Pelosinus sp. UFO1]
MDLLAFIKTLPLETFTNRGSMVTFDKIFTGLKNRNGFDNKDLLEVKLKELAKAGHLKMHRLDDDNDEHDVLVGVSFD